MKEKIKSRPAARPAKPAVREASRPSLGSRLPTPLRLGGVAGLQGRTRNMLRDTRSELKKVVWPSRDEAIRLTGIVIAVSIAMGLLLGGVDYLFKVFFEFLVSAL